MASGAIITPFTTVSAKREVWYQYLQRFTIMFLCTNKISLGFVPVQNVQFIKGILELSGLWKPQLN